MLLKRVAELYRIASGCEGYAYASGIWRRSLIGLPFSASGWFWALWGEYCLLHGRHGELADRVRKHPVLSYFRAYSFYLCGNFEEAVRYASSFCAYAPHHYEGAYLLSDIFRALEDKRNAFDVLCTNKLLARHKTWIKLANLVDSIQDFVFMQHTYDEALAKKLVSSDDCDVLENLAMGAQRAGEYETAVALWKRIAAAPRKAAPTAKRGLHSAHAAAALEALSLSAERAGLCLFLVSGTLLGFMRSGDFLAYDSDLDVGIFDGFDARKLKEAIYASGCFTIMAQRSPYCLRVRHVNGTPIDIFTHYRERDDYWHRGVKVSWHNSPFDLRRAEFKRISVWIPDPPEVYLEENYGPDWLIPKKDFDSAKDCPNERIENKFELFIHKLKTDIPR